MDPTHCNMQTAVARRVERERLQVIGSEKAGQTEHDQKTEKQTEQDKTEQRQLRESRSGRKRNLALNQRSEAQCPGSGQNGKPIFRMTHA